MIALNKISIGAACLLSVLPLTSCVYDKDMCEDSVLEDGTRQDKSELYLTLTLTARTVTTRADHTNETEEKGTNAENYINLDDMQLLLFDADQEFLQNLTPVGTPELNADGEYEVTLHIQDKYFMDYISSTTTTNTRFYIMALVNGRSMGAPWLSAWRRGAPGPNGTLREHGTTIRELMDAGNTMTLLPNTYKLLNAGNSNIADPQNMPMAGVQTYTVSNATLRNTTENSPLPLEQPLSLLRALSKIEIIDRINYNGDYYDDLSESPDRIQKVELAGYYNKGSLLPLYTRWAQNYDVISAQLTSPCIPEGATYQTPPAYQRYYQDIVWPANYNCLDFEYSGLRTGDRAPVYSCYVYEYLGQTGVQPPYMNVTLRGNETNGSKVYTMRLATYDEDEQSSDSSYLTELVRNHIYRYQINAVEDFKAYITLEIDDWQDEQVVWDYTDNIAMTTTGQLQWTAGSYLGLNGTRLTLNGDQPARCTFTFAQPINATWKAFFVPLSGENMENPFEFVDEEGNVSSEYGGTIEENTPVVLRIKATGAPGSVPNEAMLQITVTLANGRTMNATAQVVGDRYTDKFYTIIQNRTIN